MKRILTTLALLGLTFGSPLVAQDAMNYQGYLTDDVGSPLTDGEYTLSFSVYDHPYAPPTEENRIWGPFILGGPGSQGAKANLAGGVFNVVLGPKDDAQRDLFAAFSAPNRYLGITVGTNAEISPRQQVLSAPRAMHATRADHALTATAVGDPGDTSIYVVNGNVGIGEESPSAKLDVAGNTELNGTTTVNGLTVLNGRLGVNQSETSVTANIRAHNDESGLILNVEQEDGTNVFVVQKNGKTRILSEAEITGQLTANNGAFIEDILGSTTFHDRTVIDSETAGTDIVPLHLKAKNSSTNGPDGDNPLELLRLEAKSSGGASDYWSLAIDIEDQSGGEGPDEDLMFYQNGLTDGSNGTTDHLKGWIDGGSGGGFVDSSDRRLKKNIAPLTGCLETVKQLQPSTYHWLSSQGSEEKSIGFIAQEVKEVVPGLVDETNGTLGLHYSGFGVLAIGAIQELAAENTELKARLASMEMQMASLCQAVATLQATSTTPVAQN